MTFGAEVVTGLLTSIIYDGLKRPSKGFLDAASRRRGINRAFTLGTAAEAEDDKRRHKPAIDDLIRTIGNDFGLYDETAAKFISEIERSVIPDTIKHFILCGRNPDEIYPAFDLIYRSYPTFPFDSRQLFSALVAAVRFRVEQRLGDKGLFEALTAQNEELSVRLDAISGCLQNAGALQKVLPYHDFRDARLRVAKGIELSNKQINVETTQGTKKVHISRLVVPARLVIVANNNTIPLPHRDSHRSDHENSIGYLQFRRSFSRATILGDPGGGKSTLTQLLCHDLARQVSLEAVTPSHHGFDSRDLRVPLRIILRSLESRQQKNPSYSIFDYLTDDIKSYLDHDVDISIGFLRQLLILGEAVLLFDGLDEILEVGARRNMTAFIEQFSDAYASCPSLVTSRIVGYTDAPLSNDFQLYTLARFNLEEVRKFSFHLIRAVLELKESDAKSNAEIFLSQTETIASDLRENPLLLGLMVYIFSVRGDVPNNRPEIYKECSLLMFEKWDQRRDIIFEFPHDFDLLDLFGFIAARIFGNAETEDGVSEDWLLQKLREFFDDWYEDRARSVAAARVLVNFLTGRAWVMCEIGPGVFKFTHRTFLEYFFARRIEEESGGTSFLIENRLFDKVINGEWDVVSHLALQIATFRSGPKSLQAADCILKIATTVRLTPGEESKLLNFICRSLEYLTLPETRIREIVSHVFARALFLGANFDLDAREIIHELILSAKRREALVVDELTQLMKPVILGRSSVERTFAMYLLGTKIAGFRSSRSRVAVGEAGLIWDTFSETRDAFKSEQVSRGRLDIEEARTFIYVNGENLIFNRPETLVPSEISVLPFMILSTAIETSSGSRDKFLNSEFNITKGECRDLIGLIANDLNQKPCPSVVDKVFNEGTAHYRDHILNEFIRDFIGAFYSKNNTRVGKKTISECFFVFTVLYEREIQDTSAVKRRLRNSHSEFLKRHLNDDGLEKKLEIFFADQPLGHSIIEWLTKVREGGDHVDR